MPRISLCLMILAAVGPEVYADGQPNDPLRGEAGDTQDARLQTCREGLLDPKARPEERRRWAELLFSYDTGSARAMLVSLLSDPSAPDVQRALCGVLADRARQAPDRLDPAMIDPLMNLLGAESDDLRAMAAGILADVPARDVPERLGELAALEDAPLVKRLAAIDALTPNTHRRDVVGQLIGLLETGTPEMVERIVDALASTTPNSFGTDVNRWRAWWHQKARLSEDAWLAEQLHICHGRSRKLAVAFDDHKARTEAESNAVTARIGSFQRELFRAINGDQQEAKLKEWLSDSLPVVQRTAISIIRARIADEGKRPGGAVLAALLDVFRRGTPTLRRDVLEIVQNLNDASVLEAVLAQLPEETDRTTRYAIFKAIGRLNRPEAIPALIREITNLESHPECVREAAIALGGIASKASEEQNLRDAVEALKGRYRVIPEEDVAMRAALLSAMAGMAKSAFIPEFLQALESEDPTILKPAIRGLSAVGDDSELPRLRTLMAHNDPIVRLAATEAIGQLGKEDADFERLLIRLDPTVETNEPTRDAAWRGFKNFMSGRSIDDRIKAAERLRELPDFEVRFLEGLADAMASANGNAPKRQQVLERLTRVLVAQHRYTEAIPRLRTLCDLRANSSPDGGLACGLRLLDATLRAPSPVGVADLIRQLVAKAPSTQDRAELLARVAAYLEEAPLDDEDRMRTLLTELRSIRGDVLGGEWTQLLDSVKARMESGDKPQTNAAPQPPGR